MWVLYVVYQFLLLVIKYKFIWDVDVECVFKNFNIEFNKDEYSYGRV